MSASIMSWTALAERSGDSAFSSRGAARKSIMESTQPFRSAGSQSGVALRLPPQSKTRLAMLFAVVVASLAAAHESPVDHVEREFRLWVAEGRLHLSYRLQLAERAALLQLHQMDTDTDGHISHAERDVFFTTQAKRLGRGFTVELAGRALALTPSSPVQCDARLGQTFTFQTPLLALAPGRHAGRLADAHARAYPGPFRWVDADSAAPGEARVEPVTAATDGKRPAWLAVKANVHPDSLALNFVVVIPSLKQP